jgi:hypothetical protein
MHHAGWARILRACGFDIFFHPPVGLREDLADSMEVGFDTGSETTAQLHFGAHTSGCWLGGSMDNMGPKLYEDISDANWADSRLLVQGS